jgi:ornithine decarboxylase
VYRYPPLSPLCAQPTQSHHTAQASTEALDYQGPELVIDLNEISRQAIDFQRALPQVQPHYAVKANPHPAILRHLHSLGVKFEIASEGELHLLQKMGIKGQELIFSNPIKTPKSIRAAAAYGVKWFAVDCLEELQSLERNAPDCFYELRLPTDGKGSVWPLSIKFGATEDSLTPLLEYAAQRQLDLAGITFHVGSQCTEASSWVAAIEQAQQVFTSMIQLGLKPRLLNIGGGFPCQISGNSPTIAQLAHTIAPALAQLSPAIDIVAEPGRFLVASAGTLHCQVINTTYRHQQHWAYLDCGYYNGLNEMSSHFGFQLISQRQGPLEDWVIAGPTCDAIDAFEPKYRLPLDTVAGDSLTIPNLGAYSNACSCNFNGFETPRVVIVNSSSLPLSAE